MAWGQTGVKEITVTIDGKDYVYTAQEDIPLEGGKYTTLGLNVGKDAITLGTISVVDWQEDTILPEGGYVDDAARQIWGGNWRIPTDDEWTALVPALVTPSSFPLPEPGRRPLSWMRENVATIGLPPSAM